MVTMAGLNLPIKAARQQMVSAIWVVIQVSRLPDGKRKMTSIEEITGMEGDVITTQEIYTFKQTGIAADGKVEGYFGASGIRPKFADHLLVAGIPLRDELFDTSKRWYV